MDALVALILTYRYWILIPLTFVEGPIVAFVAGTLASLGYFDPFILFVVFFIRDVGADLFYYFLGKFAWRTSFVKRLLGHFGITQEEIDNIKPLWFKHPGRTLFFSKLSYGVAAGLIMVAGIVGMPLRALLMWGSLIAVTHYGVLLLLGYFFGGAFSTISNAIADLSYLVGGVVVLVIALHVFQRSMRKRLLKDEQQEKSRA